MCFVSNTERDLAKTKIWFAVRRLRDQRVATLGEDVPRAAQRLLERPRDHGGEIECAHVGGVP